MRLVFAGTPEVALPALHALMASDHDVAGVVTRPDARSGRGRQLRPSPVAEAAAEAGIEVLKPASPAEPGFMDRLRAIGPDVCPVVAYGALVRAEALEIPTHGWVNLHFSVLPAWRGAAPVQHAIMAGDEVTGATTFRLVPELDAGPTYGVLTERIQSHETAGDLLARLADHGARLLVDTLDGIADGSLTAAEQDASAATYAPKLTTDNGRVRWDLPAYAVDRHIRAVTPFPGAWTTIAGERLKLGPVSIDDGERLPPGQVAWGKSDVRVGTASEPVVLHEVQPAGKPRTRAADWGRGLRDAPDRLGT